MKILQKICAAAAGVLCCTLLVVCGYAKEYTETDLGKSNLTIGEDDDLNLRSMTSIGPHTVTIDGGHMVFHGGGLIVPSGGTLVFTDSLVGGGSGGGFVVKNGGKLDLAECDNMYGIGHSFRNMVELSAGATLVLPDDSNIENSLELLNRDFETNAKIKVWLRIHERGGYYGYVKLETVGGFPQRYSYAGTVGVTGTMTPGYTVRADFSAITPSGANPPILKWQRTTVANPKETDWTDIPNSDSKSYTIQDDDYDHYLRVLLTNNEYFSAHGTVTSKKTKYAVSNKEREEGGGNALVPDENFQYYDPTENPRPPAYSPPETADKSITSTEKDTDTKPVVAELLSSSTTPASARVIGAERITAEVLADLKRQCEILGLSNAILKFDTLDGANVSSRLYLDVAASSEATGENDILTGIKLEQYTDATAGVTMQMLAKWYKPINCAVIRYACDGEFPVITRTAVKLDLSRLNKDKLIFYRYNRAQHTIRKIALKYKFDGGGYLVFTTKYAGSIIITDTPLVVK